MKATFNESDIQSLLSKVKIFNHQIGVYELYTINDLFHYVVKLNNGTIFFTVKELEANASETLNLEMLTSITRRFTPTTNTDNLNSTAKEELQVLKSNTATTNQNGKQSSGKTIVFVTALIVTGLAIGLLVFYLIESNSSAKNSYSNPEIYRNRLENGDEENYVEPKTEAELREELRERESSNPKAYLSAEFKWRLSLINNVIISGRIHNNASEVTYKNIRFRVKILTETGYELGEHYYTLTEFIQPNHSVPFSFKAVGFYGKTGNAEYEIVDVEVE